MREDIVGAMTRSRPEGSRVSQGSVSAHALKHAISKRDGDENRRKIGVVAPEEPATPAKWLETNDRGLAERVGFAPLPVVEKRT
jgi:hypothetical protein